MVCVGVADTGVILFGYLFLALVNEVVGFRKRRRFPGWPCGVVVSNDIVVVIVVHSIGRKVASMHMCVISSVHNMLNGTLIPNRSALNTWIGSASEAAGGVDAGLGPEGFLVVALPTIDLDCGLL